MRKVFIGIGVFLVLFIVGVLIFVATFDVNRYRRTIESELEGRLGRRVTLGDMHLNLFPPRFRVENAVIGDDTSFRSGAPFIKAQSLDVAVQLMPLLHKQVEVDSLTLQRPSVNLIKNSAGVWNFASLGHPAGAQTNPAPPPPAGKKPAPSAPPSSPAPPSGDQGFSLAELNIRDGQLTVLDQQRDKKPAIYDHIDITLKNFAPDRPFQLDAGLHLPGSGQQQARLTGEGGPVVRDQPAATPFDGTLSLKQVTIGDLAKFLDSPALNGTDGVVSGDIKIKSAAGKLTAQGDTQIQNAKVHGMELGYPIAAHYDLTSDLVNDLLSIRTLLLKLGTTPLQFSGTVNTKPTPAALDVNVRANNISIAEAAKLAAASGVALSPGTTATGNLTANIQARGSADKPALNGTIAASNVQLTGKDIAQPIQIPSMNLNLTPTQVQSNTFNVISGGTTLNAQFGLRDYLSAVPMVDAVVRAPNAQLPAILAMAKAYGVTSLDKVTGAGTMNLDMHANGPLKSIKADDLLRALNGTTNLDFNNLKYSGANISRELSSIAGFLNPGAVPQSNSGVTNILKMTGNILVKNGIATTNNLQALLDIGKVGAVGNANLVDQTLNMRVTAVLSQAVSQKAGGNGISGYMQTALANNQGELVIPAIVTGTFSNPKFAPDVQQMTQMKMKGLIPNLNDPSALSGTLQNLLGGKANTSQTPQTQQQQPQQQKPQDAVQGLIDLFGKKKKKPNDQSPPK